MQDILKNLIEEKLNAISHQELKKNVENISIKYRAQRNTSVALVTQSQEVLAYLAVRMPATYHAVLAVLKALPNLESLSLKSLLDVGAGTGAASWACANFLPTLKIITCLEKEKQMSLIGQDLMKNAPLPLLNQANWTPFNLVTDNIKNSGDVVLASYVLNELLEQDRIKALEKLLNATNQILLIIEPGTPEGFRQLKIARDFFISKNAHIIAPCAHQKKCPLVENDWCHFSTRLARSKTHKLLKKASLGYEDEKFSYLAVCKNQNAFENLPPRIIKPPVLEKAHLTLALCQNGEMKPLCILKKEKEIFKKAKKLKWGDVFEG